MASLSLNRLSVALRHVSRPLLARSYVAAPAKPAWLPRSGAKSSLSTTVPKTEVSTGAANTEAANAANELDVSASEALPSSTSAVETNTVMGNVSAPSLGETATDWSKSYHGLATQAFPKEVTDVLLAEVDPMDIEIKPDGLIYLPEIKYRRVLNKAFGPGAWGLAPRSETNVGPKIVSREYALVCQGRLVAIARGEQEYFDPSGIPTATEACKSNALVRCCKDLGVASELWDPRFIREFKEKYCVEIFAEHLPTKKKRKLWRRKDQPKFTYPYQDSLPRIGSVMTRVGKESGRATGALASHAYCKAPHQIPRLSCLNFPDPIRIWEGRGRACNGSKLRRPRPTSSSHAYILSFP
ncbi:putative mitochondrial genome maintenance protein MGM101 [Lyophyllum shimeji]|uniref:Mitochondrial genome maintenance protein MGM101 n=1 Tax=Lyophyllum shimeji TaxID=47721 RepID=A0A9P3PE41_LYOSH|nr:putative mitochondrial genome maintenance protein MGM101 [Lyophyllum shimeji]